MLYFFVFIGGGLGSVIRFSLSKLIISKFTEINPIATLTSNFFSVLVYVGVLFILHKFNIDNPKIKSMLLIGFCGGFSTFSSFSYETFYLLKSNQILVAIANIIVSVIVCLLVLYVADKLSIIKIN